VWPGSTSAFGKVINRFLFFSTKAWSSSRFQPMGVRFSCISYPERSTFGKMSRVVRTNPLRPNVSSLFLMGYRVGKAAALIQDQLMLLPFLLGVFITGRPVPGKELTDEFNALEAGLWKTISLTKGDMMQHIWYSQLVLCFFPGSIFFPL
jgi:hypothetical protein